MFQAFDSPGSEEHKKLRPYIYLNPYTDVFILCFSLVSPKSFKSILDNWIPEIKESCPYILVGMKSDLRDDYMDEYLCVIPTK